MSDWGEKLETARLENWDHQIEINSPVNVNFWRLNQYGRARLGYFDRWGVFHETCGPLEKAAVEKQDELLAEATP